MDCEQDADPQGTSTVGDGREGNKTDRICNTKGGRKAMGDNYVDLFETKGLEYILVIAFLVTLVVFWKFLNRPTPRRAGLAAGAEPRGVMTPWFQLPEGFYYHQGHSWAMPEHGDVVTVG